MGSRIFFFLLVGFVYASNNPGWKESNEYIYRVNGRSLANIDESSEQYSGVVFKAYLRIQPRSDGKLYGLVRDPKYSQVHARLYDGWNSNISQSNLSWKPLPLSKKPFQIVMNNGVITDLIVNNETSNWEANILKGVVSQFQLKTNQNPHPSGSPNSDVFITMEDTVSGNTATLYEIRPLQDYVLQERKDESHYLDLKGEGDVIEVMKYKNYSNYVELPSYFHGLGDMIPSMATNKMENFVVRDTTSRAVLTGNLNQYTVQSSTTVNKVFVSPTFNDKQMGSVISSMNVVLDSIKPQEKKIDDTPDPMRLGNLVYTYDNPASDDEIVRTWHLSAENEPHTLEKPSMSQASGSPFLPLTSGFAGRSIRHEIDIVITVQKLIGIIANELFDSEHYNYEKTLDRTTTLISLIRLLDADELLKLSEGLYIDSEKGPKHAAFHVFLDSLASSGTGPALICIKNLIETNKLTVLQASEMIVAMAASVREPTPEYMKTFYELVKTPQVMSNWPLNNIALLTYTHLLRKVYVDVRFSKTQYPVNTYGDFLNGGEQLIKEEVIPFLTKQLNEAISRNATSRIHAHIGALGNLGIPEILAAYEPYLEGISKSSQFQRLGMVLCMEDLAKVYPENTRSVLFKVYQNPAETPEIRMAAVYMLMTSAPTTEMLMAMASYTNVDPQERVNAAVKSSIESAAELKGEEFSSLRASATAARPLLTKKTYDKVEYGSNHLRSYLSEALKVSLEETTQFWGSEDEFLPKGIRYTLFGDIISQKRNISMQAHISSVAELLRVASQQFGRYQKNEKLQKENYEDQRQYPLSSQNINDLLNIKTTEREQLEGIMYAKLGVFHAMFSWDNHTIESIPEAIRQWEAKLSKGVTINKLKSFNSQEMTLSFPTELGMPFIFKYDTPTIFKAQGKIDAVSTPPVSQNGAIHISKKVQVNSDIKITISTKVQSRLMLTTPFDNHQYTAGFDKHLEVSIPLRGKVNIDVEKMSIQAEIEPKNTQKKNNLFHYKSWPYTAKSDIKNFEPVSSQAETSIIKRDILPKMETTFGKEKTGLKFLIELEHDRKQIDLLSIGRLFSKNNIVTDLWNYNNMQYFNVCVSHLPQESSSRKVVFRVRYDGVYIEEKEPKVYINWKLDESDEPFERQQQIIKMVSGGIGNVFVRSVDVSVDFQGQKHIRYLSTGAFAKSYVDPRSSILVAFKTISDTKNWKPYEVRFVSNSYIPNTDALDAHVALENEPIADTEIELKFGPSQQILSSIDIVLKNRRSKDRKQYLKQLPTFRQCEEEMCKGNKQLPACFNMTMIASLMDSISMDVRYENLDSEIEESVRAAFQALRFNHWPSLNFSSGNSTLKQNEVKLLARFHPDLKFVDVSVQTREQQSNFSKIWVHPSITKTLVSQPAYSIRYPWIPDPSSYSASCVVDQTKINTFSNLTYPSSISKQWTVALQYIPKKARHHDERITVEQQLRSQVENYVILVRKNSESSGHKDLKITLSSDRTDFRTMSIDLRPTRKQGALDPKARVTVNGQEITLNPQRSYYITELLQIHALPFGTVYVVIHDAFYIMYDGQRARITVPHYKFKDFIIGLCGHFNGQRNEDFITPANCIARDYREFIKSYETEGQEGQKIRREFSQGTTQCVEKEAPLYVEVISDHDANRTISHRDIESHACTYLQTKYVEENGEICFTLRPLPICRSRCQANGTIVKHVPVHCLRNSSIANFFKTQIDLGSSPDFSKKEAHKSIDVTIPQVCSE